MDQSTPTVNPARGEVAFDLRGRRLVLRMSYEAVARLVAELGNDFEKKLGEAFLQVRPEVLARAIWILALDRHPDLTWEEVKDAEPPFLLAWEAVSLAEQGFLYGSSEPKPEPGKKGDSADPLVAGLMSLIARLKLRPQSASPPPSSGGSPPTS